MNLVVRFALNELDADLSAEEINNSKLGPVELYARSKLAIILGVKYGLLQRVIDAYGDRIYALSVHPGTVSILALSLGSNILLKVIYPSSRSTPSCNSNIGRHIRACLVRC